MLRPSVLVVAFVFSSRAWWLALVEGRAPLLNAVIWFLVAVPVAGILLAGASPAFAGSGLLRAIAFDQVLRRIRIHQDPNRNERGQAVWQAAVDGHDSLLVGADEVELAACQIAAAPNQK